MDNVMWWALYRGLRMHLGKWHAKQWQLVKRQWRRDHPVPRKPIIGYVCHLCGQQIGRPIDFSLDHLIPIDTIYTEGLPASLLFAQENLAAAHRLCNSRRSNKPLEKAPIYELYDPDFESLVAKKEHVVQ